MVVIKIGVQEGRERRERREKRSTPVEQSFLRKGGGGCGEKGKRTKRKKSSRRRPSYMYIWFSLDRKREKHFSFGKKIGMG